MPRVQTKKKRHFSKNFEFLVTSNKTGIVTSTFVNPFLDTNSKINTGGPSYIREIGTPKIGSHKMISKKLK